MLVTPRPGVNLDNLIESLRSVNSKAYNLRGGGGVTAHKRLLAYLEWAGESARILRYMISEADVLALVLNRQYELLLSSFGSMASSEREVQRVVNDLVSHELDQRVTDLDEAIKTLQSEREHWSRMGYLVLPDSSFYIRHQDKLEDADFTTVLSLRGYDVDVLVPIVVVDELDGLKQHGKSDVRWRAGYTLAVLDRLFSATTGPATLHEADFSALSTGGIPRGQVTIELLFDPPGHVRLAINDDEIVDRAVAVQALAGRPVTLVTFDTGQATRARNAGLHVLKLREESGEEPTQRG